MVYRVVVMQRLLLVCILAALLLPTALHAQIPGMGGSKEETKAEQPVDPYGRETPRGMIHEFLSAIAREDYERASEYLDLSSIPTSRRKDKGIELAKNLQRLLDHGGHILPRLELSEAHEGKMNDDLGLEMDRIGTLKTAKQTVDITVIRIQPAEGVATWLISSGTLEKIPSLLAGIQPNLVDQVMPEELQNHKFFGIPAGHWIAMPILLVLAYILAWAILSAIIITGRFCSSRFHIYRMRNLIHAALPPFRLFLTVWIFMTAAEYVGVSILARQNFGRLAEVTVWFAMAWLLWRLIDVIADASNDRLRAHGYIDALSATVFLRRGIKGALVIFLLIAILDTLGFDVTTGLAALGIGGLALALGAQKTVENLVGSVTLIADRPIRIGDFCRFGDQKGTVEDIGMRSTRIRTNDRTIITIPNGDFSAMQIENYTQRDRFWFNCIIGLRYETTPAQIRHILSAFRTMLDAHPKVEQEPTRVHFVGFGDSTLNIELFAYVTASNVDEFQQVQEDLNLQIMEIVEKAGTSFAFPSQTLYFTRDTPVDTERLGKPA